MDYRTLGNSGTVVSTLCLGTMTFGAESDEQVAHDQLDRFLEQGGNFLDTADVYADGESETIIGRWLAARSGARDRMVIAESEETAVVYGMPQAVVRAGVVRRTLPIDDIANYLNDLTRP